MTVTPIKCETLLQIYSFVPYALENTFALVHQKDHVGGNILANC